MIRNRSVTAHYSGSLEITNYGVVQRDTCHRVIPIVTSINTESRTNPMNKRFRDSSGGRGMLSSSPERSPDWPAMITFRRWLSRKFYLWSCFIMRIGTKSNSPRPMVTASASAATATSPDHGLNAGNSTAHAHNVIPMIKPVTTRPRARHRIATRRAPRWWRAGRPAVATHLRPRPR